MNTPKPEDQDLIKRNLSGQYDFNIKAIFSTSFALTKVTMWHYVLMIVMLLTISVITTYITVLFTDIELAELNTMESVHRASLEIILQLVLAPFMVAVYMAGVKFNANEHVTPSFIFTYVPRSAILCITTLMLSVITMLGFALYIIPGIYLFIATGFTLMLVADKQMNPVAAMILSIKMVTRYLGAFLIFQLIFFFLFLLCLFTFGVAMIIVVPLYYNAKGLLYKELFGYGNMDVTENQSDRVESTFNA